ncbi:hypothetical protein AHiyo8_01730 [Arthrobacter sp. Hiyo8]|nr:hypothetical protein AHiyo8_01730 [Arthrobacter sp. Hiyo8]
MATTSRWTVSGQIGEINSDDPEKEPTRKAPIDIRHLLEGCNPGCRHVGPLRGAWAIDEQCLLTLDELSTRLPAAANCAFYLRAATNGLIVIDIEKTCPPEIAQQLLALPGILYTEESMSGLGYHFVAPLPANFSAFPIGAGKRKLQEEHGWYEILIDHWCTFTRRPVAADVLAHARSTAVIEPEFASVADLYASLAEKAKASAQVAAVRTSVEIPEIPHASTIIAKAGSGHSAASKRSMISTATIRDGSSPFSARCTGRCSARSSSSPDRPGIRRTIAPGCSTRPLSKSCPIARNTTNAGTTAPSCSIAPRRWSPASTRSDPSCCLSGPRPEYNTAPPFQSHSRPNTRTQPCVSMTPCPKSSARTSR